MSNRWPGKVIVGLTGNIATGKSTVLQLARQRSALTLDADTFVHEILATDPEAQREIVGAFGDSVLEQHGAINRAAVAAIVFNDEEALAQLERILHPRVRRLLLRQIDRSPASVVFIEAIKLLEGSLAAECDQIWVTRCPEATQVQRLMTYRQLDEETAWMRVRAQSSQEIKVAAADVIIDTGGSLDQTKTYFELAWARLWRRLDAAAREVEFPALLSATAQGAGDDGYLQHDESTIAGNEPGADDLQRQQDLRNFEVFGPDIIIRRAQPDDVETITELIGLSTEGKLILEPAQLLASLGERGYLIGQQADEITAIGGWNAENLVASIDCLYAYPPEAINITGAAVLQEIEVTANELICEVIIVVLGDLMPASMRQLLEARGFIRVDPESLPQVWRSAFENVEQPDAIVMMKVLRDTRQVRVRTVKEYDG